MQIQKKKEPVSLYAQTKVNLLRLLQSYSRQHLERLPAESELAAQLEVSRVVIRDVLAELETRGYVIRKRGVGTLINARVFTSQPRVDERLDFDEIIRAAGFTPSCSYLSDQWTHEVPEGILDADFFIGPDESLLRIDRVFLGDGKPLIASRAYIKESAFQLDHSKWQGYRELSIFEFLETFCHKQAHITLAELSIFPADSELAALLQHPEGTPLLLMRDTGYAAEGEGIVRATAWLCPEILPVKLVRQRI